MTAFLDLNTRLGEEFDRVRTVGAEPTLHGLFIDEREVAALLDTLRADVGARLDPARLDGLRRLVVLDPFDEAVLLACVAPEICPEYERVYGFLQDDITRKRPTVGLLLRLFDQHARDRFHPGAPLALAGLVTLSDLDSPLAARVARADERVVRYLLGSDLVDERLDACVRHETAPRPRAVARSVLRLVTGDHSLVALRGRPGIGKREAARAYAAGLDRDLLVVDVPELPVDAVGLVFREALLLNAVVYFSGAEQLPWRAVQAQLAVWPVPCLFGDGPDWEPPPTLAGRVVWPLSLPMPTHDERAEAWAGALEAHGLDAGHDDLAVFRLTVQQIVDAVAVACAAGGGSAELRAAARAVSGRRLATLGAEIVPRATWDQLILPDDCRAQLLELCRTVRYHQRVLDQGFRERLSGGTGVTALFSGVSGTGKTMAAEVIAGELGLALFRIDLAGVVSKWIGETEKNLDRVFQAATDSNAILFFDEADALFGKRSEVKDSRDRYANLEVSYLLQKMEGYDGVAILATNMRHQMDDAFLRRLTFNVVFPLPEEDDRARIWAAAWPDALPRADDVDVAALARLKLVGGNIKNIILAAAHLAAAEDRPVAMEDLFSAVRREYQKLGKQLSIEDISTSVT